MTAAPSPALPGGEVTVTAVSLPELCYRTRNLTLRLDGEQVGSHLEGIDVGQSATGGTVVVRAELRFTVPPKHAPGDFDLVLYCSEDVVASTTLTIGAGAGGSGSPVSPPPGPGGSSSGAASPLTDAQEPGDPGDLAALAIPLGCGGAAVVAALLAVWGVSNLTRSSSKTPKTLPEQLRLAGHQYIDQYVAGPPTLHPLDDRPALTLSYRPQFDPGVQHLTENST